MEHSAYGAGAVSPDDEKWYYMDGDQKRGPVDAAEMISLLASGTLAPDTRVWTARLGKWAPADTTDLVNLANSQNTAPAASGPDPVEAAPAKRKRRWWIWLIIGLLLAALVGVALAFLLPRKSKPSAQAEVPSTTAPAAVPTYQLTDHVVYEDDSCAFIVDDVGEKGEFVELDVRCVNKTQDVLLFSWRNTSINGNMFDPLWSVRVSGDSTTHSSITFPRSTLDSLNLLSADEIKFVLAVFNDSQFKALLEESAKYIVADFTKTGEATPSGYQKIDGYDAYLFTRKVKTDKDGRPYYTRNKERIYFDEIRDANGQLVYGTNQTSPVGNLFYHDLHGRPYYFAGCGSSICHTCESTVHHDCTSPVCLVCGGTIQHQCGTTVYYDGYGFAFHDPESGKNYFYDAEGHAAWYGKDGVPEYYEGTVPQALVDAGKPRELVLGNGCFLVHEELSVYPTGLTAEEVVYPERITASTEQTYWDGDKGTFVVLGGETDEFRGYIVRTYIENRADHYMFLGWDDVEINGVSVYLDTSEALRPHSCTYRDILIPNSTLTAYSTGSVKEIAFRVHAVGENLSIPLYPIVWDAVDIDGIQKP